MKRIISAMLTAILMISLLCACGSTSAQDETSEERENATNVLQTDKKENEEEKEDEEELEQEQPVIVESGYTVLPANSIGDIYLTYAVKIKNPNKDTAVRRADITVTGKNEDGSILFSEDHTMGTILPGDTIAWADATIDCKGKVPNEVEISIDGARFLSFDEAEDTVMSSEFVIENLSEIKGDWDTSLTGEITNNSDVDFDSTIITIIYRNQGEIVGGYITYVDNLYAGKTSVFDTSSWGLDELDYDEVEVMAQSH